MINIQDVKIFNAILQIQKSGKVNMLKINEVISYLRSVKENEAANWVQMNFGIYLQGVIEGFKNEPVEIKNIVNKNY